jgi:tetratricopeptide (TPR) repeat protein
MNRRLWWIGAAALCLSSSLLFARQGVFKTRDGKTIEGDIEEKPDQVIVSLHGIRTAVNRDNIDGQVEYFDNIEARYKDRVAKLPKNPTAADRLAIARWLYDVKAYDLALQEIEEARKIDPNSADAATLEQTVISQRRIDKARGAATPAPGTGTKPPADNGAAVKPAGAGEKARYLTAADVNTIRQMEWREKDTIVPRATVPPDVRKRYVELKALDPGAFAALTMPQQAYYILSDHDVPGEMKRQIKLTTDPQAVADYRRAIQPLLVNNCATIGCHGGHNAGRFFLYNQNTEKDEVAYTNFYILQNFKESFGDKEYSMIDRNYPDRSIMTYFALPPDASELKHPDLKGQTYKPLVASRTSQSYHNLIEWMKELQAAGGDYGIKYDLPGSGKGETKSDVPKPDAPKPADAPKPTTGTPKPK